MCNTLEFDYARRLDILISTSLNAANTDISLNANNTDETIRSGNVVGIEVFASDFSNIQVSGNPLITATDLQKIVFNLKYEGNNDLVLKLPASRIKMGQIDAIYRPLIFKKNTRIDVGRSTLTIATALTTAPCAISIIFYLNNISKY